MIPSTRSPRGRRRAGRSAAPRHGACPPADQPRQGAPRQGVETPDALERRLLMAVTVTNPVTEDAYVADSTPNSNYGSAAELYAKKSASVGSNKNTFLKFDMSSTPLYGNVTSVRVNLYGNLISAGSSTSGSGGVSSLSLSAYPAPATTWGEGSITWNNKPATGATALDTVDVYYSSNSVSSSTTSGVWYSWDVTEYARGEFQTGNYEVAIAIKGTEDTAHAASAIFASTEDVTSANRPFVTIVTDETKVNAAADAYVSSAAPTTNYGTNTALKVQKVSSGTEDITYMKYGIGTAGNVGTAILYVYGAASAANSSVPVRIVPSADTSWGETTVNWNNKPLLDTTLCPLPEYLITSTTPAWYAWDITEYVRSQKVAGKAAVTLALTAPSNSVNFASFNSKEAGAANAPRLMVSPGAVPAPTTVSTSGQVAVYWQPVFGAASYHVLRKETGTLNDPNATVVDLTPSGTTSVSYVDTSVTNYYTYFYYVEAYNAAGQKIPVKPQTPGDCWADAPGPPEVVGKPQEDAGPIYDPNSPYHNWIQKYEVVANVGGGSNFAIAWPKCKDGWPDPQGAHSGDKWASATIRVPAFRASGSRVWVQTTGADVYMAAHFGWKAIPINTDGVINCGTPEIQGHCVSYDGGVTFASDALTPTEGVGLVGGRHDGGGGMGSLPSKGSTWVLDRWAKPSAPSSASPNSSAVKIYTRASASGTGTDGSFVDIFGPFIALYVVTYSYLAPPP